MGMDFLQEELEHQEFMAELRLLQESIFWGLRERPVEELRVLHNDVVTYGDDPAFSSVLFDHIVSEDSRDKR